MRRRRRGQPDLDRVEVVECPLPDRPLLPGVPPVALVRHDQIEGMDRNLPDLIRLVVQLVPAGGKGVLPPNRFIGIRWFVAT